MSEAALQSPLFPPPRMSHDALVALAARWLHGTRRCVLVAQERIAWMAHESPDAIGWDCRGNSILVECKTSVADFLADLKKPHRMGGPAMGRERWYLTEDGLLTGRTLPEGWGWLVVRGGRVHRAVIATPRADDSHLRAEIPFIVTLNRKRAGVSVLPPDDLEGDARRDTEGTP